MQAGIETQDVENEYVDMGCGGMNWEIKTDVCALPCVKQIASGSLLYSTSSSVLFDVQVLCDDLEGRGGVGWDGRPRGRGHTHTPDSFCGRAETNTTL